MAFQWLRKYKGQIILGSSVAGIWLGYTWYGEIFGLSSYIKKMGFYDEGASEVQEITPETLSLIDKVKADMRAHGMKEHHLERCRFFNAYSSGATFSKGTTCVKTGAVIGIPLTYGMSLPQMVPILTGSGSTLFDYTKFDMDSEAGHQYMKNILVSENAKKFAIAWQMNFVNSYYLIGKSFIGISVFYLYFAESRRRYARLFSKNSVKRILTKSQKVSDKALGYHKPLTEMDNYKILRAYNFYLQIGLGIAFIVAYHVLYYSYNWYMNKKMDRVTAELGEEYLQGGVEYYEKFLERNKIGRSMMDFGERFYKENGDIKQGYIFSPYRSISKGKDYLQKLLANSRS